MKKIVLYSLFGILFIVIIVILNSVYEFYLVKNVVSKNGTANKVIQYVTELKNEDLYMKKLLLGCIPLDEIQVGNHIISTSNLQYYQDKIVCISNDLQQNYYLTSINPKQHSVEFVKVPDIKMTGKTEIYDNMLYVQGTYCLYKIDLTNNTVELFIDRVTDFTIKEDILIYTTSDWSDNKAENLVCTMNLKNGEKKEVSNRPISHLTVVNGKIYCMNYNLYAIQNGIDTNVPIGIYTFNLESGELEVVDEKKVQTLVAFQHHLYGLTSEVDEETLEVKEKWVRIE